MVQLKRLLAFVFVMLFLVSIVSAQPPFEEVSATNSLQIVETRYDVLTANQTITFHIHTFNSSNGLQVNNATTDCFLHLINQTGNHLIDNQEMDFNLIGGGWDLEILGSNFSSVGIYELFFICNATDRGGAVNLPVAVTESGQELTTGESLIYFIVLLLASFSFALCLYLAIRIEGGNYVGSKGNVIKINWLKYSKIFLSGLAYGLGILLSGILVQITRNYTVLQGLHAFFFMLNRIALGFLWPIMVLAILLVVISIIQDKKLLNDITKWNPTQ